MAVSAHASSEPPGHVGSGDARSSEGPFILAAAKLRSSRSQAWGELRTPGDGRLSG